MCTGKMMVPILNYAQNVIKLSSMNTPAHEKLNPIVAYGILVTITVCVMIFILHSSREYPEYKKRKNSFGTIFT